MNILLLGSGGREHALAKSLYESPKNKKIFCAPGNPGIKDFAELINININNNEDVLNTCISKKIELVIIGPEVPLVNGLADFLNKNNILVFGPRKIAAQLEGSKKFTKQICKKYNIPTAKFKTFDEESTALKYLQKQVFPIVIKADGLAAGKGVIIAESYNVAEKAVKEIFSGLFKDAGKEIVIEEFLVGEEISYFIIADENNFIELTSAQDHKRIGEGDTGPNTGGMGAYSPAPLMNNKLKELTINNIIKPTLMAMRDLGCPYTGILYAGLMITDEGPKLIEYNVRFGDPECQVILPRLKSDLLSLIISSCQNSLNEENIKWDNRFALTIVMASEGYPNDCKVGYEIKGINKIQNLKDIYVYHAGTKKVNDLIFTNGGRVLNITSLGETVKAANCNALNAIKMIDWRGSYHRNDIGWRAIKREENE
ncbi:MAG: phosphoribosylamine--glycine ligase [Rhodobiaceae bacterium]|nr:phosphoribosylamine--glycine ligase [Rhodobiaceae bacterium]